jgi:hypothetical protein
MEVYLGYVAVHDSEVMQAGQRPSHLQFIPETASHYAQPLKFTATTQDIVEILARGAQYMKSKLPYVWETYELGRRWFETCEAKLNTL